MNRRNDRKLKHYGNIYREARRKRFLIRFFGTALGLAALVLLGWFLYPPVRDMILNAPVEEPAASSSQSAPAEAEAPPEEVPPGPRGRKLRA